MGSLTIVIYAQTPEKTVFPLVWYNAENLFDCENDSLTMDGQFTPEGDKHWNTYRYWDKIKKLSKSILAVSGWNDPTIIGLCEVENEKVMKDLVYNSPLASLKLKYIHKDSPDPRGIDVALMYNPEAFEPLQTKFIPVNGQPESKWVSRDILYCKGVLDDTDTLHIFVNHWPSKYGGAVKSEPKREHAAHILTNITDSIVHKNPDAALILMGDFNETSNEPAFSLLKQNYLKSLEIKELKKGTHKYKGNWAQIDYFLLSDNLLVESNGELHIKDWKVGDMPFLMEPDANYSGNKPYRTFVGFRYNGGISDHLPLVLYLGKN